jgi:hypothetical protein
VVRLGIEAPPEVAVYRQEVWERVGQRREAGEQPGGPREDAGCPQRSFSEEGGLRTALTEVAALWRQLRAHPLSRDLEGSLDRIEQELQSLQWCEAAGNAP